MNVGLLIILVLLVLSFLGIPIYIALGIGTLLRQAKKMLRPLKGSNSLLCSESREYFYTSTRTVKVKSIVIAVFLPFFAPFSTTSF